MTVFDAAEGSWGEDGAFAESFAQWAREHGIEWPAFVYRVEVDEATMVATIYRASVNEDGRIYRDETGQDIAVDAPFQVQVNRLPPGVPVQERVAVAA